jgi:hypothetical protein
MDRSGVVGVCIETLSVSRLKAISISGSAISCISYFKFDYFFFKFSKRGHALPTSYRRP